MVVAWFIVRSTASIDGRTYALWVIAAGALALVAPLSGLVVFVATSVAFEPDTVARTLSSRELVLLPLTVGVLLRVGADRFRWRPVPADLARAGASCSGRPWGSRTRSRGSTDDFAWRAAQSWYGNMAAPVIVLVAAAWTARGGSTRVIVAAASSRSSARSCVLLEYASPGLISREPVRVGRVLEGLRGAAVGHDPVAERPVRPARSCRPRCCWRPCSWHRTCGSRCWPRWRVIPLLVAHYLTFSRSPLLACYAFAVIVAWRVRRAVGIAVLVGGLILGAVLLPAYLRTAERDDPEGAGHPGHRSWSPPTSIGSRPGAPRSRCGRDEPLIGQGYLAYKELGPRFGDPVLGSPHNEWLRFFAEEGTIVGLVGSRSSSRPRGRSRRVPGWLGTGDPRRIPRLRHRGVVQQPVAVRPGQRRGVLDHRGRAGTGRAGPCAGPGDGAVEAIDASPSTDESSAPDAPETAEPSPA